MTFALGTFSILPVLCAVAVLFYVPRIVLSKCTFEDHPFLIAITYEKDSDFKNCPAVIIHKDWALGAHHSCFLLESMPERFPREGTIYVRYPVGGRRPIIEIINHYRYNERPAFNDIILAKVKWSFEKVPITLPWPNKSEKCATAILLQHDPSVKVQTLKCYKFDIFSHEKCAEFGVLRPESAICAQPRSVKEPIVPRGGHVLVCNDYPAVVYGIATQVLAYKYKKEKAVEFIRVSYYMDFINMTIHHNWRDGDNSSGRSKTNLLLFCFVYVCRHALFLS